MLRHCALGLIAWFGLGGCFGEAPQADPTVTATDATTSSTASATMTTADTTGGDFIEDCRACQADQCERYAQECAAAPGCGLCVETPFTPTCLGNADFRPLASCSCESCGEACGYMCPGGGDACRECQMTSNCSPAECSGLATCLPCLGDPYADGCAEEPAFQALRACQCDACEPACVWQCDGTAPACASCMTMSCGMQLNDCLGDDTCEMCFNNPATPGCAATDAMPGNELYATLGACVCTSCSDQCGLLFNCG